MTSPTRDEIEAAAAILRAGGLVAFPTETVYGLGANALDAAAVRRIFAAKGRPSTSPLIVHVDSVDMARRVVVSEWPNAAQILADAFWPGPLTLILPKRTEIPHEVTAGLETVGVRSPAHPVAQELIRAVQLPLAAPSANRFTHVSPTEAQHVRDSLGSKVDCILDGGRTTVGIESTVLSLAGARPMLLRPGMISREQIEERVGSIGIGSDKAGVDEAHLAPGQHERHYSPATPLVVTETLPSGRIAHLWWNRERTGVAVSIRMPSDAAGYARELYTVLHAVDKKGVETIVVEPVPASEEWAAIRDRLRRAAGR